MSDWYEIVRCVEPLEDVPLDHALVRDLQRAREARADRCSDTVHFYTPTFKSFQSSEISGCGKSVWPAVSTTAGDCKLQCDHCKAKILESMIPARTPEALWRVVNEGIADGARGMLLTGGSNHRNEVEYGPYYATIRRIKDEFPDFRIALHTALVDEDIARCMEQSGIDAAMMDVIGAQETVTRVYHLRRRVEDFERSLEALVATRMKVVPHIVVGLHYGRLLGERNALEMIRRHRPDALVLVVVMPFYAPVKRPFETPDANAVGRFFLDARERMPDFPLLLGCARPPGTTKARIDVYAVLAGLDGIAHPSDGIVELAARLERRVRVTPACCSIAVGDEVMALDGDGGGLEVDLDTLLAEEHAQRRGVAPGRIPVVTEVADGGCGR
ncbi:radical SAM superfamily protein [bacterium BMS3Bbin12]|nr:radical SAM superfamily protein [bacterium BMS3Abin12]GBE48155.1 radical SAM superfamily protein [bacterium BMS3Bbin12]GBE50010.1 radical SAM superfamily protein [bacterium BMS3Bbin13]